ncbi:MAG: phage antirepressor KilAC domain-containing protein [Acinetobacter sp.]
MNMLAQFAQNQKTMSTRVIAELCEKEHRNVKRDSEVMFQGLQLDALNFEHIYLDSMNRPQTEYLLDKKLSICLVSGYSVQLRMAIIDRWEELEGQNQSTAITLPDFTDPAEAAMAWAEQYKAKQLAEQQLQIAAPKVQYFDRVADTKNLLNASQVGKKIGLSAVKLNQYLADLGVYDRRIAGRTFADWFIKKGYGEVKQTENGYPQSKFTNKGEQWVVETLTSEGVMA